MEYPPKHNTYTCLIRWSIIKIAKIRRGSEGVKSAYIKRFSGRFEEIDKEEYMGMKQFWNLSALAKKGGKQWKNISY